MLRKKIALVILVVSGGLGILTAQTACQPTFKNVKFNAFDSASLASFDPVIVAKGEALYSANCVACHGDIAKTTVPDYSVSRIQNAINSVTSMRGLVGKFSLEDVNAISIAINKNVNPSGPIGNALDFQCEDSSNRGSNTKNFKRLMKYELVNTVNDLLGASLAGTTSINSELAKIRDDNVSQDLLVLADGHDYTYLQGLYNIGKFASDMVANSAAEKAKFLGACGADVALTDACMRTFIQSFGLRAFRRPLTGAQVESYFNFYKNIGAKATTNPTWTGFKAVFTRFLASPYMSYHIEQGSQTVGARLRLTDYEVASRISYKAAGTMPDAALLAAAGSGQLQTLAGVKSHTARMLLLPSAKDKASRFIRFYANLDGIDTPNAALLLNKGIDGNGLQNEMKQEAVDFANNVIWTRSGTFTQLMNSSEAFPRTARMAKILGTAISNGTQAVNVGALQSGLLLRPAILSNSSDRTDIIHRGLNIRKRFMCSLGTGRPPDDISSAAKGIDFDNLNNREGIARMTGSAACIGCHAIFNPVGYALEGHDQIGMVRSSEPIFNAAGAVIKSFPINTYADKTYIDRAADLPVSNAADLMARFGSSDEVKACFTAKAFTFYNIRGYDSTLDGCTLSESLGQLKSGTIASTLLMLIANDDIFWKGL